ncbi:unnamed protein product [Effrenium voratum]|uniref:Uncharacterized protein n=1 Tax=Effrenium voratum TaxID=2562239 RepID=A0AA36IBH2_9DINO|nr:unnamed protein product [Effrenium voratum]
MAKIAYSVGQPGDTPSQADLEGLTDGGERSCTIGEISALRRLVFESQTLMIAQIKATVEGKSDEGATELAPAEREDRMKRQAERLRGLSLEGELECGYAGYDTVMKMLQDNAVTYLHPNRFPSRRFELLNEKKKQEILVTNNQNLAVKSNASELLLLQALTRRALCLDLVGAASFDVVEKYQSMLMRCLQEPSPPGYRQVDVVQILKADQRAWLRLSEMVKSGLKRGTDGQKGILRSAQSSGDPELDKAVYDSTEEELGKGRLRLRVLSEHIISRKKEVDARNVVCWFERVNTASNIADKPSRGDDDLKGLGERMHLDISNLISEATMPNLQGGEEGASGMSHVA